ncbi:MAG: hypothetical protein D6755_10140 [Anaerolineae bacterium]|nr:MAG: hypothetical protein D6755_10140 [Anaerolineae bacterium]
MNFPKKRLHNRLRKAIKARYLRLRLPPAHQPILFIFGCQRSGTTLLLQIFEQDWNTQTYQEASILTRPEAPLRLREASQVRHLLSKSRASFQVLKPLVESQHARHWLDAIPHSKAVWMFRHYRNVARSNLQKFGMRNGIEDLRPIAQGEPGNWRNEGVPDHVRALVQRHYSEQMNPYDAAVLFWYARNALFLAQNLAADSRIRLCRYADLVEHPHRVLPSMYAWLNRPSPTPRLWQQVRPDARLKPADIPISPEIEEQAQTLWEALLHAYRAQKEVP